MGKETKIGLAVIFILLITFGVVLARRLTTPPDDSVASALEETADPDGKAGHTETPASNEPMILAANTASGETPAEVPDTVPDWNKRFAGNTTQQSRDTGLADASLPSLMAEPQNQEPASSEDPDAAQDGPPIDVVQTDTPYQDQVTDTARTEQTPNSLTVIDPSLRSNNSLGRYASSGQYSSGGTSGGQMPTYRQSAQRPYSTPLQSSDATRQVALPSGASSFDSTYGQDSPHIDEGEYEVQPNDNYWGISKKLYGTGAYFKALVEHNRKNFPNANRLQVGEVISAPSLAELEKSYPGLCPKPSRREAGGRHASTVSTVGQYGSGRVYTVEEGDTLFDIARYELGKASRWAEIYELNRDALGKDFDYLTPGMKLALPDNERPVDTVTRHPDTDSVYQR